MVQYGMYANGAYCTPQHGALTSVEKLRLQSNKIIIIIVTQMCSRLYTLSSLSLHLFLSFAFAVRAPIFNRAHFDK